MVEFQHFVIMRLKKNNKQKNTMRKNQMSNKYQKNEGNEDTYEII